MINIAKSEKLQALADNAQEAADKEREMEQLEQDANRIKEEIKLASQNWLQNQPIRSHDDIAKKYAK